MKIIKNKKNHKMHVWMKYDSRFIKILGFGH